MLGSYRMFLVVWLTHPGVILHLFKEYPAISGLWQVLWLNLLHFTITKKSSAIVMAYIYSVISGAWIYFTARSAWTASVKLK
jgi:hypothetical protein